MEGSRLAAADHVEGVCVICAFRVRRSPVCLGHAGLWCEVGMEKGLMDDEKAKETILNGAEKCRPLNTSVVVLRHCDG